MNKQLTELIEYINGIEIPISHTSTQESHAHTIKRQILSKAKSLQSEDGDKIYTQEQFDNAKKEEWWKGWKAYGESL